jgi:hypothetical protein
VFAPGWFEVLPKERDDPEKATHHRDPYTGEEREVFTSCYRYSDVFPERFFDLDSLRNSPHEARAELAAERECDSFYDYMPATIPRST